MGTISDKLMRIINTKEDIRQALISKGYDVPTSIPFKEYAKMILDLPCNADSFPDIEGIVARYSASGLTNEQMAANPVWADKTGNGRDLQLKNFSWKRMSGVGGYVQDFNDFRNNATVDKIRIDEQSSNSIKVTILTTGISNTIYIPKNIYQFNKSYFIKISSEGYDEGDMALSFYAPSTSTATTVTVSLNPNGITEIPAIKEDDFLAVYINVSGKVGSFTVEQLPLYPGALVFDGVDDYGVCENFPILTKEKGYTVVALRQWITRGEIAQGLVSNVKNWLKDGAFLLEYRNIQAEHLNKPISFGAIGSEMDLPHILTYQTSKSYNGVSITTGNFEGTDVSHVGKLAPTNVGTCINAAIWELVFLDHDATEEELTKIKDYFVKTYPWLFPDQAWTVTGKTNEDEDRATIANITGNGNDLVLSNFGFAEGSGYGLYGFKFLSKAGIEYYSGSKISFSKHQLDQITLIPYILVYPGTSYSREKDITVKIKVAGLKEGVSLTWGWAGYTELTITEDGTYSINARPGKLRELDVVYAEGFDPDQVVTIEQIPEYEGYLVTDGVDDKIVSAKSIAFTDTWTIITDAIFLGEKVVSAGILVKDIFGVSNLMEYGRVEVSVKGGVLLKVPTPSIKAICSDGRIYDADWNEYQAEPGTIKVSEGKLYIGMWYDGMQFCSIAFKNIATYNGYALSKDDCIKAYNYLQTIKAK